MLTDGPTLSIVVPLLNEEAVLADTHAALTAELAKTGESYELLFVDDGSTDRSRAILLELSAADPRVRVVALSRNFGHEMATTAGLHQSRGRAAVVIDADLQDPPELIHEFLARWRDGYHVVYGVRTRRDGEGPLKKLTAFLFYRLIRLVSDVPIPADTGDFRLMDRRVLDVFRTLKDDPRFFRGLVPWCGFKQEGVPFARKPRAAGTSKYRPAKLIRLAADTVTSFSTYTALLATLLAVGMAAVSAFGIAAVVLLWLTGQVVVTGLGWLAVGGLVLWNVQFLLVCLFGEYLVRAHRMVQRRPLYVVDEIISGGEGRPPGAGRRLEDRLLVGPFREV
jgi:dolichol-phosphate mannosyltransferase